MTITNDAFIKCAHCNQMKPETSFGKNGRGDRGTTCNGCRNERRRARGENAIRRARETPEERFARTLRGQYRLTLSQYDALLAAQDGVCAACQGAPDTGRKLVVDHCHTTGVVRALLCITCNVAVGFFEIHGQTAAAYLAKYGGGNPALRQ